MNSFKDIDNEYVLGTYGRFDVEIARGSGSEVYDVNGKRYIDMGSGIGVTAFGLCDKEWTEAVSAQLNTLQHMSNLYYTEPCAQLAKLLCNKTGMKKVFFCNSGAEANECAIKTARKYAAEKKGSEYSTIITLKNSFHGRTITTLAATGQDKFHEHFMPLTEGFDYADANDFEGLVKVIEKNKTAAVMMEIVQGEGGVIALNEDFVNKTAQYCTDNDILLIIDEVQTGNGRTGELYAYMNYKITPDIVTTAKGLGGGLPLGAILFSDKCKDTLKKGEHGSTFGGNPVCCAGAISIISRLDDKFLDEVKQKSKLVFESLENEKGIESVSGMGLMIGIKTTKNALDIVKECNEKGVLCLTAKDKVRLLPALNISVEVLKEALDIIKSVCANQEEKL